MFLLSNNVSAARGCWPEASVSGMFAWILMMFNYWGRNLCLKHGMVIKKNLCFETPSLAYISRINRLIRACARGAHNWWVGWIRWVGEGVGFADWWF